MIVALILMASIVFVGLLLYAEHQVYLRRNPEKAVPSIASDTEESESECCGLHITCEKDSLLAAISTEIEYYDDEELDRFTGKDESTYTEEETEEFRDVLLTMRAEDIAGWARSLQLRGISLPTPVRDELLMLVSEARSAKMHVAVS